MLDHGIRVVGLKYNSRFNPAIVLISSFDCTIGILCNFSNNLTVYETEYGLLKNGD